MRLTIPKIFVFVLAFTIALVTHRETHADDHATPKQQQEMLRGLWNSTVFPYLKLAEVEPERNLDQTYLQYLTWLGTVKAWNQTEAFVDKIDQGRQMISQSLLKLLQQAYEECAFKNNPAQVKKTLHWLKWANQHHDVTWQVLGELSSYRSKAEACLRFELSFDSKTESKGDGVRSWQRLEGTVPLRLKNPIEVQPFVFEGTGTLRFTGMGWEDDSGCVYHYTGNDTQLSVPTMQLRLDEQPLPGLQPDIQLVLASGVPTETLRMHCPDDEPLVTEASFWWTLFHALHQPKFNHVGGGFTFRDWTRGVGEVFAQIRSTLSDDSFPVTEETVLELRHTPQR